MLSIITGRQGSGKSRKIYEKIAEDIKENREVYLIVPEQYSFQAEKGLIDYLQSSGIMGVHVLSFSRLAYQLLSKAGTMQSQPLSKKAALVILKKILIDTAPSLQVFARSWMHDGFCEMVYQCIQEMKKNKVRPIQMHHMAKGDMLQRKMAEIALIYQAYEEYIQQGYCDAEDMIEQATDQVQKQQDFHEAHVYIDGFHTLDRQRIHLIETILAKAPAVTVALTYEEEQNRDVFALTKKMLDDLLACAQRQKVSVNKMHMHGKKNSTPVMCYLEENLFRYPNLPRLQFETEDALQIIQTNNLRREMSLAAEKVLSHVQNNQLRYKDIALFCNDLDAYRPVAKEVFADYGIPLFIDEKYDIEQNALVRMLFAMLQMFEKDAFGYADVFTYLKSGYTALDDEQINRLENYVLRYGIRGRAYLEDFWKISKDDAEELDKINEDRKVFAEENLQRYQKIKQAKTYDAFAEIVMEMIQEPLVLDQIEKNKKFCEENGLHIQGSIEEQIGHILEESLQFIAHFLKGQKARTEDFYQILKQSILSQQAGILPATADCVILGDFARSRTSDIAAAIIVGANEGLMPKALIAEGLFTQREKRELVEVGLDMLGEAQNHTMKERFYIYNTLSKPLRYLSLSAPLSSEAGEGMEMSLVAENIAKMFDIPIEDDSFDGVVLSNKQGTYHKLVEIIATHIQNKTQPSDKVRDLLRWYGQDKQYAHRVKRLCSAIAEEYKTEDISPKQIRQMFDSTFAIIASSMQAYAACPFQYFLKYVLKPKKREIWEISSLDIGSFMHHVGEIFTTYILENQIDTRAMTAEQTAHIIGEIVAKESTFKNDVFGSDYLSSATLDRLKGAAQKSFGKMIDHLNNGEFDIAGSEMGFGKNQPLPGVYLGNINGFDVSVEGKIDRVDTYEKDGKIYHKIIDYKTGKNEVDYQRIYYGLDLQLNFYMQACLSAEPNHLPAGMFYYKLHSPVVAFDQDIDEPQQSQALKQALDDEMRLVGVAVDDVEIVSAMDKDFTSMVKVDYSEKDAKIKNSAHVLSEEEMQRMLHHSTKLASGFAEDILSGAISPKPYKGTCKYCDYAKMCKWAQAPGGARYRRMEKIDKNTFIEKIRKEKSDDESAKHESI